MSIVGAPTSGVCQRLTQAAGWSIGLILVNAGESAARLRLVHLQVVSVRGQPQAGLPATHVSAAKEQRQVH